MFEPAALRSNPAAAPSTLLTSVWLWITSSVLGGVAVAYAVAHLGARREQLRLWATSTDAALTTTRVDTIVTLVIVAALVGIALPMVLQLVFALVLRSGRSWARVVLTVLSLITIPALIVAAPTLAVDGSASNYVVLGSALALLLVVMALIFMFLPSSSRWLRGAGKH